MLYQEVKEKIDIQLMNEYPGEILKRQRLIPGFRKDGFVHFFSDSIPPLPVIDKLEVYASYPIKLEYISSSEFELLVNEYLEAPLDTVEGMIKDLDTISEDFFDFNIDNRVENLEELAKEAPIIKLVNAILTRGLKVKASDIHLEPAEEEVKLRYRIDGMLYERPAPPRKLYPAIVTRIKIMAGLNIAERRLPQEGRIRIRVLGREIDIRVSSIATLYGEMLVLRLLDRADVLLDLNNLGFADKVLADYKKIINLSHGIILVTGPTGSGKTTTLYATLENLNSEHKKIITIEDPIEYQLEGINQIQVKPEIDFTFARGLRSILRQDPDIIMVGEIRDSETASIAIQAALTGHLVFATLHTNDAPSAIIRLLDMGVENYLLSATLKGVIAQRLVRVLCQDCCQEDYLNIQDIDIPVSQDGGNIRVYRPLGCQKCNNLGYQGRMAIYEFLSINQELTEIISTKASLSEIRKTTSKMGVKSLVEAGLDKVQQGITSLDEVLRVSRS